MSALHHPNQKPRLKSKAKQKQTKATKKTAISTEKLQREKKKATSKELKKVKYPLPITPHHHKPAAVINHPPTP